MADCVSRLKIETLTADNAAHRGGRDKRASCAGRSRRRSCHIGLPYWPNAELKSLRQSFRLSASLVSSRALRAVSAADFAWSKNASKSALDHRLATLTDE